MMSTVTVYANGAVDWSGIHMPGSVWRTQTGRIVVEHLSIPTIAASVLEDIHFARHRNWTPEAVYIQRDLFLRIRRGMYYSTTGQGPVIGHKYRNGKRVWDIDGVQVRFSTGRRDYYIYCGNGKEISYP
jgi:hypothetical protein